jgi:subtilisin family serine protease
MRKIAIGKSLLLVLAMLLALAPALTASGATPEASVRVWVEYRPGAQAQVHAALEASGARFHYTFERLDAFVVSLPPAALRGLDNNPNVVGIEADPVRELVKNIPSKTIAESVLPEQVVPYGVDMVQARDLWDANRDGKVDKKAPTGAGRTVCIIDTGFYDGHEDFAGVDVTGGYSQVDGDDLDRWNVDGYGHGTHVAGTIVAANNSYGVVGVTPGTVSLFIVKIFDDAGEWVSQKHASDLTAAIYLCADNGANIISMSLGGSSKSLNEERAFDELYASGILSIAAAGNGGNDKYHYPASYPSVVSVAAIDINYAVADFSQFNDQVELAAPGVDVLSTVPFFDDSSVTVDGVKYAGAHIEFSARGSASGALADGGRCLTTGDWVGMVVLCQRGDISFYDKVMNVQNSGGTAAVIYNNVPGGFLGTLGDGNSSTIIAISLSQEDGQYLVASKLGADALVASAVVWPASGYEAWAGTSMATPHVSAVAALLWSWNPDLTNEQIRAAMQDTAMDLGEPGRDVYYGFGLVQAYDAWISLGGGKPPKK